MKNNKMIEAEQTAENADLGQDYEVLDYLSWADFRICVEFLVSQIKEYEEKTGTKFCSIYGIPRGGLILGVSLSYNLRLPLVLEKSEIKETTLIVDDCTNTGKTLNEFTKAFPNKTAVIFSKPKSIFKPDFYFRETDNTINYCWENKDEKN